MTSGLARGLYAVVSAESCRLLVSYRTLARLVIEQKRQAVAQHAPSTDSVRHRCSNHSAVQIAATFEPYLTEQGAKLARGLLN